MRVYLLGYFGAGAWADDLILTATEQLFREALPDCKLFHNGILPHPARGREVGEFFNENADLVVLCGGSLLGKLRLPPFNDIESWVNCLAPPLVTLGTGWRTESTPLTAVERFKMETLLNRVQAAYVRGWDTLGAIREHGLPTERVRVLGDPGLCWTPPAPWLTEHSPRQVGAVVRKMADVEIAQDADTLPNDDFHATMAVLLDYIAETEGAEISFFPMSSRHRAQDNDFEGMKGVWSQMIADARVYYDTLRQPFHEPAILAQMLGQMDFVVSQRLHGSLIPMAQGVPVFPIEYQFGKMHDSLSIEGLEGIQSLITPQAEVGVDSYRAKREALTSPELLGQVRGACQRVRDEYLETIRKLGG